MERGSRIAGKIKRKALDGSMKMIYAPIIIPTLNRIEHLERCITSLQKNVWAQYTTLIISVDYPPEEKYESGYRKVCEYLSRKITGFAHVEIIYQSENLGAYENTEYLKRVVRRRWDRYIFSEDDNEFSPNFIEYVDKGLDEFENDENIIAICSCGIENSGIERDNVVLSQNFAAYGYGTWIVKMEEYSNKIDRKYLENIARSNKLMWKLAYKQPRYIFALQSAILKKEKIYQLGDNQVPIIDQTITMYMIMEKKYVLVPCLTKVRNWGYDGSGENCHKDSSYDASKVVIDQTTMFQYVYRYPLKITDLPRKYTIENICRIIMVFMKIGVWRLKTDRARLSKR